MDEGMKELKGGTLGTNAAGRASPAHSLECLQSLQLREGGGELGDTLVPDLILAQRVQAAGRTRWGASDSTPEAT